MSDITKIDTKNTGAEELFNFLKPFVSRCLKLNHDLNNPLTGLISFTEFLLDEEEPLTDNQREYVRQIMNCAERIEKEITDLSNEKIELSKKLNLRKLFSSE